MFGNMGTRTLTDSNEGGSPVQRLSGSLSNSYGSINQRDVEIRVDQPSKKTCCSTRYGIISVAFFAYCLSYAMRANMSVALVAMVNSSRTELNPTHQSDQCHYGWMNDTDDNSTNLDVEDQEGYHGEFDWNEKIQGAIISAFVASFGFGGLCGGRMSDKFGAKKVLTFSVGFMSVFTLLTPLAASIHYIAVIVVRFCEGFLAGMVMPSMNTIVSRWMPKSERSIGVSILLGGTRLGNVPGLFVTGFLCNLDVLNGWPLTFYLFGTLGILWTIIWLVVMYETPQEHPRISPDELQYILRNQGIEKTKKNAPFPYRKVFTSLPVWASVMANIGESWGMATLPLNLPLYLSHILHFDYSLVGVIAGMPSLLQAVFMWCSGIFTDFMLNRGLLSRTAARKLMNSIGQIVAALFLVGATLFGCDRTANVTFFVLTLGINGCVAGGFRPSVVDMAPDFAGTIMGMSVFVGNIVGFSAPYVVGVLTNNAQTLAQWHIVFWINAGFYAFGGLCFLLFGSSELQPWGLAPAEETTPILRAQDPDIEEVY